MKSVIPFLAFAIIPLANAQTAYTPPSGVKIDVAGNSLTSMSATLNKEAEFSASGTISNNFATESQTITVTGTSWTATQWTTEPHLVYITDSATPAGEEAFLITGSPTATTLTVSTTSDLLTLPGGGARFPASTTITIRKACTLGNLFGTTASDLTSSDRIYLWNDTIWNEYAYSSPEWYDVTAGGLLATNHVVFPSEGILIQRNSAATQLTLFGDVPAKPQVSTISGNGLTLLSSRFPVGTPVTGTLLPSLNIQGLSSWTATDRLYILNGGIWTEFAYSAPNWFNVTAGGTDANSEVVEPSSAIFLSRTGNVTTDTDTATFDLPYTVE